ncbi:putative lipid II flippase FtsW [Entomomonas sp. E2T0]|uniref:putative lipid II flippase FtsW n=1 Tax=Entomomonas sp. E2T0 TaxID=2930213 RepID=UPI002228275B|nr:putative lipid II flippase FtsW [Entomomonas sp. E2T0]UYZ84127.1 putative lipid II flippase FtsW [Entomomonas sp. E2T0]
MKLSIVCLNPSPIYSRRGFDVDFPLLAGCLLLLGLGAVMIASASSEVASAQTGNTFYNLTRHLVYLAIGILATASVLVVPIKVWQKYSAHLLCVAVVLLVAVLIPGIGRNVNGASRWIGVGLFNIQPSELGKLFAVIYLAGYLVRRKEQVRDTWSGFFKPFVVLLPVAWLFLLEPDFGATVVMMGAALAMLFLGGVSLGRFLLMVLMSIGAVVFLVLTQEYRMHRLMNFTDPFADQFGSGYQLTQSLIAFGRGDFLGLGLGNSIQKQFYLPEAHTDFVFAVLAEELGLVGSLCTVALFVFVGVRALIIGLWAEREKQYFSAYVAYGIAMLWLGQFIINVGVNVGLLPTKGLTLPFLSYGGSSLVICCICLGILLRIDWERRYPEPELSYVFTDKDFPEESSEVKHGR